MIRSPSRKCAGCASRAASTLDFTNLFSLLRKFHQPRLNMPGPKSKTILVAGDVCLDVVGVPIPEPAEAATENWRLTGETRTHFLPGGAMLLAEFIGSASIAEAAKQVVLGPQPVRPAGITDGASGALNTKDFLDIAERLRREEIVHSLLALAQFPTTAKKDDKSKTLRVEKTHGFSGPTKGDPSLAIKYPKRKEPPKIIVLDDTGNRFRKDDKRNPWPPEIRQEVSQEAELLIIHKLHRPLPRNGVENKLWAETAKNHPFNRLVLVSVDDLREMGIPISFGLSWERTALDVVWHLLNVPTLEELKKCPRLIIRLGESGAIYWQHRNKSADKDGHEIPESHSAWLVYDPGEIEGGFIASFENRGRMVALGSAFTAALVQKLASPNHTIAPLLKESAGAEIEPQVLSGIRAGLLASRRLVQLGFGINLEKPVYPGAELFAPPTKDDAGFACRPIPIIPQALEPDRGYWRLLDDIFTDASEELREVVELTATGTKSESPAAKLLAEAPIAVFAKALRTYDRREMEHYRALYSLLQNYVRMREPERPLSVAVFGPPGAGKSFGVKKVAEAIAEHNTKRPVEELTFNLSQYQTPEELAAAFHLVRDRVLKGKIPLVFFDEFDTTMGDKQLAWLRYFLAPMQDGEFLDRGTQHPIGQAIFVFAGGTCDTFQQFAARAGMDDDKFKAAKGPDFLSRLRGALDIPSLNFLAPREPRPDADKDKPATRNAFNPYASVENFPCYAAILLRRAGALAFQLGKKAGALKDSTGKLRVRPEVLRALLHLPDFLHGNRSFEALLDMSRLQGSDNFNPSLLPPAVNTVLHANPAHIEQLVATEYPFPKADLDLIAQQAHEAYIAERKTAKKFDPKKASHQPWNSLSDFYKNRNRESARAIPEKLRSVGLWFRKAAGTPSGEYPVPTDEVDSLVQKLAADEHDRWVADQRRQAYVFGPKEDHQLKHHPCLVPWTRLDEAMKNQDRDTVQNIPRFLAAAGYEIVKP